MFTLKTFLFFQNFSQDETESETIADEVDNTAEYEFPLSTNQASITENDTTQAEKMQFLGGTRTEKQLPPKSTTKPANTFRAPRSRKRKIEPNESNITAINAAIDKLDKVAVQGNKTKILKMSSTSLGSLLLSN